MIFKGKHSLSGFTLVELMVVIAMISIITLGVTSIDFNRISDKQRSEIFANTIVSKIETVRNNALIGKGIGVNLETPDSWNISVFSDEINTNYQIAGVSNASIEQSVTVNDPNEIIEISCLDFNNNKTAPDSTPIISFAGDELSLSGCNSDKILEITTAYKIHQEVITVNTLSGLIQVN